VKEVGLPVNPIHVLDLVFILPAMIVTSVMLWRRNLLGLFFAVPLMVFAAAMGAAIIGMSIVMRTRGLGHANGVIGLFVVLVALALGLTYACLRRSHPTADSRLPVANPESRSPNPF
jgi:NADH:ubiquinone oxidoreductase subunit K